MARSGLVPSLPSEFSKSTYWESFFKKRTQAFEWYGTYYELCGILHRYVKPADRILVAGCGNSELSENMYDSGLKNSTNIDISQTVIDQMTKRKGDRDQMEYLTMDLTDLKFEDETYSVIVDKGTLDAIMSDDSGSSNETTDKILAEYFRVLKNGGRYICITLAQDFILKKILSYFPNNGWLLRLHRVYTSSESSSPLPVFAFVMTKFKNLPKKILEICVDETFTPTRFETEDKIQEYIQSQQQYSALTSNMNKEFDPSREHPPIQMYTTVNSSNPRFTMYVVDKASSKPNCKFAVFLIPLGSERDWMFNSEEGRRRVANQTPFRRVLFVALHPSHEYPTQDELQKELNSTVMDFAPPGTSPTDNVPYLSTNSGSMEERIVRFKGHSSISGEYIVEDFTKDGEWFRHLVFSGRQSIVITEIKLKKVPMTQNKKSGRMKRTSEIVPDHSFLTSGYARPFLAGLVLRFNPEDRFKAMILGVGGGAMSSYILHNYRNCHLTALEIDGDLIELAQTWFGLPKSGNESLFQLCITDGVKYIHNEEKKFEEDELNEKYDILIIDIGGKDYTHGIACPTVESAELKFLRATSKILKKNGLLIVNLLCWDDAMRSKVMYNIRRTFKVIARAKCEAYYNEVIYCFKEKPNFSTNQNLSKSAKKRKKKKGKGGNQDTVKVASDETQNLENDISKVSISPSSGQNGSLETENCSCRDDASKIPSSLSILSCDFVPPQTKPATRLQKYDSDWFIYWKERTGERDRESGRNCMDLKEIIDDVLVEGETDYYEPNC